MPLLTTCRQEQRVLRIFALRGQRAKAQGAGQWACAACGIDLGHEAGKALRVAARLAFDDGPEFRLERHRGAMTGERE